MEHAPCPITGSRDFSAWLDVPDRFAPSSGTPWRIVRSSASGMLMLNPRPDEAEILLHYSQLTYDPFLHQNNARTFRDRAYLALSSALLNLRAAIVMQEARPPADRLRILEVGCSTGRLLLRLHRKYSIPMDNLFGIEPDRNAAETARSSGLANIRTTELHKTAYTAPFDRIIFWHALEHIHRITETLDEAHRLLDKRGMLVVALPNAGGKDASHYGRTWVAYDAPRHLYHFTPKTLAMLLEKHGFRVARMQGYAPDALYNAWYSEKLRQSCGQKPAILPVSAALQAARSILAGRNPEQASGFVCHAVRS